MFPLQSNDLGQPNHAFSDTSNFRVKWLSRTMIEAAVRGVGPSEFSLEATRMSFAQKCHALHPFWLLRRFAK